jgi:hypothetical protein
MNWLRDQLTNGPVAQRGLKEDAKAERFSWATVRRAKDALGVITEKSGYQPEFQVKNIHYISFVPSEALG